MSVAVVGDVLPSSAKRSWPLVHDYFHGVREVPRPDDRDFEQLLGLF
jgi:hypothetical protein